MRIATCSKKDYHFVSFSAFIYLKWYHLRNRAFDRQTARSLLLILVSSLRLSGSLLLGLLGAGASGASSICGWRIGRLDRCLLLLCLAALQSVDLGESLVEGLALGLGDLELLLGGLAGTVAVL